MNSFKKILVPIDGSKYSDKALQKVTEIVKELNSKIILIYVIEKSLPLNLLDRSEYLRINRKFGKKKKRVRRSLKRITSATSE